MAHCIDLSNRRLYCVGFLFNEDFSRVLLQYQKPDKPSWLAGKFNGIGGKIEIGESPSGAMVRETKEETGLDVPREQYRQFHYERHPSGTCLYFYAARLTHEQMPERPGEWGASFPEVIQFFYYQYIPELHRAGHLVYNLEYLVPMAKAFLTSGHQYLEG